MSDASGKILHINDKFVQVCGYTREELLGKDHRIINSGLHGRDFWSRVWADIHAGRAWRGDVCNRAKDGHLFWVDTVIAPLTDQAGKLERIVSLRYDITVSKHALQALEEAKREAERANLAKSAFLANTSHEIRTPLNAIIGMAHLLGQASLSEDQLQQVEAIQGAGTVLLALLNDVLDLAKIEAGEMVFEARPFSLGSTLSEIAKVFQSQAASKQLTFSLGALPKTVPPLLQGDELRVRQIFHNLISNAIKFTAAGKIGVDVHDMSPEQREAEVVWLRFMVRDTGVGIAKEDIDSLFTPFMQLDRSLSRKYGGTGLGLSIVKQLVEGMGGRVGCESELGKGSTFWLELPFTKMPSSSQGSASAVPARALEVLIVDDEAYQRDILFSMATQLGWHAETLASGEEMIQRVLSKRREGHPVDCLVIDWRMPGLDGLAAIKRLRTYLDEDEMPKVIMATAYDREGLRRVRAHEYVARILTKPVNPSALFNAVNEAVVSQGLGYTHVLSATTLTDGHSRWLPGLKILVVDDSALNLDVCRRILERQGAHVVICLNGQQAVEQLTTKEQSFDLVLMDVQMPVMDGLAATRIIRATHGHTLPVVGLTAGVLHTQVEQALTAGMNQVLHKPLNPEDLIRVIRKHVEATRSQPLAVEQLPELQAMTCQAGESEQFPEIPGIDRDLAYQRLQGDRVFLQRLLCRFVEENQDAHQVLEAMLRFGQMTSAAALLHKLRGMVGNFGASEYAAVAHSLEKNLLTGVSDYEVMMTSFEVIHLDLVDAIRSWLSTQETIDATVPMLIPAVVNLPALEARLAQLDLMLAENLFSASALSEEIEATLQGSHWAEHYQPVRKAVRELRFASAREALTGMRNGIREKEAAA